MRTIDLMHPVVLAVAVCGWLAAVNAAEAQKAVPGTRVRKTAPTAAPDKVAAALPKATAGKPTIAGYVLTHEHPTYGMAFGGNYAFAGKPGNFQNGVMEKGYTAPCGGCRAGQKCDHGEFKGNFTAVIGGIGSDMGDHPSAVGPVHDSNSHLRYSTEWVKEAFRPTDPALADARMRIMVAYAVENEAMCEQLYYVNKGNGGAGGNGYPCSKGDSLASLERQLDALKAWVKANSGWMEIAYSAADAKRIVNADKLAIILGIESEYAFGAEDRTFDPVTRLQRYYDQGVRTFYLAHKINSRLAGADIYYPSHTDAGKAIRATQAISGCLYYDDHVGPFPLENGQGHNFCDNNCGADQFKGNKLGGLSDACASKLSEISEANMLDYVKFRGDNRFNGFHIYPKPPGFSGKAGSDTSGPIERNNLGLSHDGERVVREAMLKGMMVNIDHVSSESRRGISQIASSVFKGYPLNAFHNNPNAMLVGNKGKIETPYPHEYDFTNGELDLVRDSGGFFGVRLGPLDAKDYPKSGVKDNCPQTATESAKVLAYLLDRRMNLGYSLDYATITKGVFSRTFTGCRLANKSDNFHRYDGHDTEGLSHIGMMRQWHQELETVGLAPDYLDKLKNEGAPAFIAMWELSEGKAKNGKQIPRQTFSTQPRGNKTCAKDSECTAEQYCSAGLPNLTKNACQPKQDHGQTCVDKKQCKTNRCAWGFCADADECQKDSDCNSAQYCGDPISGKRSCKALKGHGVPCTAAGQCTTKRCSWGFCADQDECRSNSDCTNSQYCADPIANKRSCKTLNGHGAPCTSKSQCASDRCSWGFCADADECRSNSDCKKGEHCGDPIGGKAKCKKLLGKGKACTKGAQCASGSCTFFTCK